MGTRTVLRGAGAFLVLLAAAGCQMPFWPGPVEVRVRNASEVEFGSVVMGFPHETLTYGPMPAGGASAWSAVEEAYRYAAFAVTVDGETLRLQPIDWVGEEPLDGGRYTFELDVDEGNLVFRLIEE